MPFGKYLNFDDCVKKNADKKDPKAYCAEIMMRVGERKRREAKKREKTPR